MSTSSHSRAQYDAVARRVTEVTSSRSGNTAREALRDRIVERLGLGADATNVEVLRAIDDGKNAAAAKAAATAQVNALVAQYNADAALFDQAWGGGAASPPPALTAGAAAVYQAAWGSPEKEV